MYKYTSTLLLLLTFGYTFSQVNPDSLRHIVLKENIQDSSFIFGKWSNENEGETHLKLLGSIKGPKNTYKIMTSSWLWGNSKKATNRVLIFNMKNEYLGNYKLTLISELPTEIRDNQLEFLIYESPDGHKKSVSRLAFERGIPQQFFLPNTDGFGNFYYFDKNSKRKSSYTE